MTADQNPADAVREAPTPSDVFHYARRTAERAERSGKGTVFPTVRQAAKRFQCPQQAIVDAVEDGHGIGSYFNLAVGVCIGGAGWSEHSSQGDYEIEAYP